ncbi:class II fumarate hydratase [Blochmannia endosymbiont of Polyrhachis (Hedomyrma) turneri]|uniref:class II fumarate hydratase n=1 Tax=Blochmannia endosymbiont of Polyrhachis (Hedomyrma) turneri TaxID=1505596 RepID=UPI00061A80A7|nr:class II fumarate hydratase [Blochmannia endosymbiont of Polyrhachis (Hedomyrma) turneri]AKC59939.1 Fumarate hydratase class II [Blochmannia endosymbiont of Polyrhachis (Hedomyrma) turneri]
MSVFRLEKDSIGYVEVPVDHLWGAQTQRSLRYFKISYEKMPNEIIIALAQIKYVAAMINSDLGYLDPDIAKAIMYAADEIISGNHFSEFPVSLWQTGSGTQSNMNMNEVLANRANTLLFNNQKKNNSNKQLVHPNDHVNKCQSSNDVFPTAMHIAAVVMLKERLLPAIIDFNKTLFDKSNNFKDIIKIGRTHLQDAVPLTLGQEMSGWLSMLEHNVIRINDSITDLYELALGGTAVGTGLNAYPEYSVRAAKELAILTKHPFVTAKNKFESLATCDALVHSHSALKCLAVSLIKISNDIRWLSSGPRCGIGELNIPENEPGSSIMPGKINPTQCEAMNMLCYQVLGNDTTINIAGSSGNFELNVCKPVIIYNVLQSIRLLSDGIKSLHYHCVMGIKPNIDRINYLLNSSLMLVTALNPHIGYDKSSEIVKIAYKYGLSLKDAAVKSGYLTEEEFKNFVKIENMVNDL